MLENGLQFLAGLRKDVCPSPENGQAVRLIWLASRDPFSEAEAFARKRTPASVYDLIAWEVDFVRELLSPFTVHWTHVTDPNQISQECHVLVYSTNQFKLRRIRSGLKRANPRIVFHLSDEWGNRGKWHAVLKNVPLVLRQYHFTAYKSYTNIKTIPLGYMEGMLPTESTSAEFRQAVRPMRMRNNAWSFIGAIKGDRERAIDMFSELGPNHIGPAHPADMAEVYLDSKFVLCPGGNRNILCFRNFEASVCGAIPVVAGCSVAEYREAVGVLGDPPWIFHETWEAAFAEVRALLRKPDQAACRSEEVLAWWRTRICEIRRDLKFALS